MKKSILVLLLSTLLFGESFSKHSLIGVWEISSLKLNGTVVFGKDYSIQRGSSFEVAFKPNSKAKNLTTGTLYQYELKNGLLKIYQIRERNGYLYKDRRYDLFKIIGNYEGCYRVKIIKKGIPGFYFRKGYKWCKIGNYPIQTTRSEDRFDF